MMITAYHFLLAGMRAGSGHEKAWEIGETRTIADPQNIRLCKYGYHSSPSLWDALAYAPGPMACLVKISKPLATDDEQNKRKAVSASRTLIKAVNVERELRLFACDCAERVLHIYEKKVPNDKRARTTIEVARKFADGKATKEELAAAGAAAGDAASAAAGAGAWAARAAEIKWQHSHFKQMFDGIFE